MADLSHALRAALRDFTRLPGVRRGAPAVTAHDTAIEATADAVSMPVPSAALSGAPTPLTPPSTVLRVLPIAGLLVALGQGLAYALFSLALPHPIAVLLALAAGVLLTGATHESGWLRWCGPGAGIAGLVITTLLRFETLAHIGTDWLVAALLCAASVSRAFAVLLVSSLPRQAADSHDDPSMGVGARDAGVALLLGVLPVLGLALWTGDATAGLLGLACALAATAIMRRTVRKRSQPDGRGALDATQQVVEAAFLVGMLVVLGVEDTDADSLADAP
jgi:adenosylcobinamide-GDP ribazoletransferase